MKIRDIVRVTRGSLLSGDPEAPVDTLNISTDSRTVKRGDIFIALKGENFDGNFFLKEVYNKGAAGAIVSHCGWKPGDKKKILVKVGDTTRALQDIASFHRSCVGIPVIGVTGSNGKTTTKDMISAVLSSRYKVLKSEGTRNNHIGVPQTLLNITGDHDICVIEMGANHKGEIRSLAAIAKPTIAVITNIGPSHLEFFKDLEGVFRAKSEILGLLGSGNTAILNGDDAYLNKIRGGDFGIIKYGLGRSNKYTASNIRIGKLSLGFSLNGDESFTINALGIHNLYNALAAITVGTQLGIDRAAMRDALKRFRPAKMRLDLTKIRGVDIINDAYNSNPLSMKSALDTIKHYPAKARWVVSGDMLELGEGAVDMHKAVGEDVAMSNVKGLLTFGKLSRHTLSKARSCGMDRSNLWHCSTHSEIAKILKRVAKKGDAVLLKGSRGMKLEEVIGKLKGK